MLKKCFLLALDDGITRNTIESLASHNITLVVPDDLKLKCYEGHLSIYGLTQFLYELIERNQLWISRKDCPKIIIKANWKLSYCTIKRYLGSI
ncbi:hypothetical protein ACT7DP_16990 [Bacillus paranthracis]